MKYKVGDKVIIRKDLDVDKSYAKGNLSVIHNMLPFKGKVVTIRQVDLHYRLKEDSNSYAWSDDMILGLYNEKLRELRNKVLGIKEVKE